MEVLLNERVSMERPAWTSTPETGGFEAYRHRHIGSDVMKNYYVDRKIKIWGKPKKGD